jgi:hypothetical protein
VSIDCPLDCEYLREAHKHEKLPVIDAETLPNRDLMISNDLLRENEELLAFVAQALGRAVIKNPQLADFDIRDALQALIRTQKTLQSGLVYESVPSNPLAAMAYDAIGGAIEEFRRTEAEQLGVHRTRASTVLGLLVFIQHLEISHNNGRRRGRAFLDAFYEAEAAPETPGASSLILP